MSRTSSLFLPVLLLSLLAPALARADSELPDIAPGLWETEEVQVVDGVEKPATTHQACYRPEEVKKLLQQVEELAKAFGRDSCKLDLKVDGDVATTRVDCHPSEQISVKGSGKTRFTRKSFTGTMKIKMKIDMPEMKKRQVIESTSRGRWVGKCPR